MRSIETRKRSARKIIRKLVSMSKMLESRLKQIHRNIQEARKLNKLSSFNSLFSIEVNENWRKFENVIVSRRIFVEYIMVLSVESNRPCVLLADSHAEE